MRWLWIDRFLEFESGQSARAMKNLSRAEDLFRDHWPSYPVMPAALMLEGLAQTGGILVGEANDFQEKVILAKIVRASFEREVTAGNILIYDAEMTTLRSEGASILGRISMQSATADLIPVGEADIFFAHLDQSRSQQLFGDFNFVFSGELKKMLGLTGILSKKSNETTA